MFWLWYEKLEALKENPVFGNSSVIPTSIFEIDKCKSCHVLESILATPQNAPCDGNTGRNNKNGSTRHFRLALCRRAEVSSLWRRVASLRRRRKCAGRRHLILLDVQNFTGKIAEIAALCVQTSRLFCGPHHTSSRRIRTASQRLKKAAGCPKGTSTCALRRCTATGTSF